MSLNGCAIKRRFRVQVPLRTGTGLGTNDISARSLRGSAGAAANRCAFYGGNKTFDVDIFQLELLLFDEAEELIVPIGHRDLGRDRDDLESKFERKIHLQLVRANPLGRKG